MKKEMLCTFFPMQMTKKFYLSTILLITIAMILLSTVIWMGSLESEKEHRGNELYFLAEKLDNALIGSYDDLVMKQGAQGTDRETQSEVLSRELQPIVDTIAGLHPKVCVGYYSSELQQVLAAAPDLNLGELNSSIQAKLSTDVFDSTKPKLLASEASIFWQGEPGLIQIYPIYRGGKLTGYSFAGIKMKEIYGELTGHIKPIFVVCIFILGISNYVSLRLFQRLRRGLSDFALAIVGNSPESRVVGDIPELNPILELIKDKTAEMLDTNARLKRMIAIKERTEQELKSSNEMIINILASIRDPFFVFDKEWNYQYINQAAREFLENLREGRIHKNLWEDFPRDHYVYPLFVPLMEQTDPMYHEMYDHLRKQWYLIHAYPFREGLVVYLRDMTERKQAEEALRQSEERFSKAFAASPSWMCIIDDETEQFVDVNLSFVQQTGYTHEDLDGRTWREVVQEANREIISELKEKVQQYGRLRNFEISFYSKTGEQHFGLMSIESIFLHGRKCWLVVVTDITERKKLESELIRLDRLNLIGQMAAGISHEIRNPMTTVRGFLQMLGSKEKSARNQEYYKMMIEELDRANAIITEFLAIGRNKTTEQKIQSLNAIIQSLAPLIEADAMGQEKLLKLELDPIPDIMLNAKEVRQVILNLSRNGLEAMKEGGELRIKTYSKDEEVILVVRDSGSGMSAEQLQKLGTPFFTTKDSGTGLGLAICYGIISRHQGRITVKSGEWGTEFNIHFPLPNEECCIAK